MTGVVLFTGLVLATVLVVVLVFALVVVLDPVPVLELAPLFLLVSDAVLEPFLFCFFCSACLASFSCFCLTAGQSKIEGSDSQPEKSITADKRKTGRNLLNQNSVPMANLVKIFFWSKSQPP